MPAILFAQQLQTDVTTAVTQQLMSTQGVAALPSIVAKGPRPIEALGEIYHACGLKRIVSTYTGPLIRLRKTVGSTTTEQDFYAAAGSDLLDTAAVTTWLAGTTGYVRTWYDQRGGRNWEQATTTGQPTLTISGSEAYISQSSGRRLFGNASMFDFGQYKDGVTVGIVARLTALPNQNRTLYSFTKGSQNNQSRFSVLSTTTGQLRGTVAPYDDLGSYTIEDSAALGTSWFRSILAVNFRNASIDHRVNGTALAQSRTIAGKSEDTPHLGASINGTVSTDAGNSQDVSAMVLFTRALSTSETKVLDSALIPLIPGYTPAARPSTIHLFGDSQFANPDAPFIADPTLRSQAQLSALYEAAGTYRLVRNKGSSGQTSTAIKTRLLATTIGATEPVLIQAGVNDGLRNDTSKHDAALQNLQDMAAYVTSGRYFVCTIPYARTETNGTSTRANTAAFNARIRSTFPNNYIEIAEMLATAPASSTPGAPANTDGATPAWLMVDNFHRNPTGVALEVAAYKAALDAKGW